MILKFIRNIKNIFYSFKASKIERYAGLQKIDSLQIIDVQKRLDHWLRVLGIKEDSLFVKEIYQVAFVLKRKKIKLVLIFHFSSQKFCHNLLKHPSHEKYL